MGEYEKKLHFFNFEPRSRCTSWKSESSIETYVSAYDRNAMLSDNLQRMNAHPNETEEYHTKENKTLKLMRLLPCRAAYQHFTLPIN